MLHDGQSEGNEDQAVNSVEVDAQFELSAAGARLREVVGAGRTCVFVSSLERSKQTLLALDQGGFPGEQVGAVRSDPRIRARELGNFLTAGTVAAMREEERLVGRFYYRLPNAESCADVFDRVESFWKDLFDWLLGTSVLSYNDKEYDACLLIAHPLTIRLLLMDLLNWTVRTFEAVCNPGIGHHIVMKKNMDNFCYELCPEESYPPRAPWSTLEIWIWLKSLTASEGTVRQRRALEQLPEEMRRTPKIVRELDQAKQRELRECSRPYTVVDYMTLPPSLQEAPKGITHEETQLLLTHLVEGHGLVGKLSREELRERAGKTGLTVSRIHSIDWSGDAVSYRGKMLRA